MRRAVVGVGVLSLLLQFSSGALAGEKAKGKPPLSEEEVGKAVRSAINQTGGAINKCNDRYVGEYPNSKGTAKIDATVSESGRVVSAKVETDLKGARNLRPCLEKVAKTWTFPPPQKASPIGLTVPIAKGAKFRIPEPGEKPKKEENAPEPPKLINFLGQNYIPRTGFSGK